MPACAGEICLFDLAQCHVFCFMCNSILHCFDKIQDRDIFNMTAANFPSWLQEFQSSVQKTHCFLTCDKAEDYDGDDKVKENSRSKSQSVSSVPQRPPYSN